MPSYSKLTQNYYYLFLKNVTFEWVIYDVGMYNF